MSGGRSTCFNGVVARSTGRRRRRCRRICAIKVEHIITQIARLATKCRGGKVTKEGGCEGQPVELVSCSRVQELSHDKNDSNVG